jgi:hypothetical protein
MKQTSLLDSFIKRQKDNKNQSPVIKENNEHNEHNGKVGHEVLNNT